MPRKKSCTYCNDSGKPCMACGEPGRKRKPKTTKAVRIVEHLGRDFLR